MLFLNELTQVLQIAVFITNVSENAQFGVGAVFADGPLIDHLEGIVSTTIIVDGGYTGIGESARPRRAER